MTGGTGRGRATVAGSHAAASDEVDGRVPDRRVADRLVAQAPSLRGVDEQFYPVWEAVYRDNVERVYRLMFAKVGNRPDAEDLTADVFLAALGPLRMSASASRCGHLLAAAALALASLGRLCRVPTIGVFGFVEYGFQPALQALLSVLVKIAALGLLTVAAANPDWS
jgi:hypothetical protein